MRITLTLSASSLLVLVACGGAPKPSASDPSDTAALEGSSSSTPSSASSGSAAAPSTPSSSDSSGSTASASGGAAPASSSAAGDSAPPAAIHPVPGATGSIDGKPFSPKLAQVVGPLKKDGRLVVLLHEGSDCIAPTDAKAGDGSITLMVPWQDGYKVDLGSLKRGKKGDPGEAAFTRVGDDKKGHVSSTFKPTGRVTILSAPTAQNAFGKMKIDLSSGDYILAGDLDVKVCGAIK